MRMDHAADLTNLIRIGNDMGHIIEIWDFLRVRKKWWLAHRQAGKDQLL